MIETEVISIKVIEPKVVELVQRGARLVSVFGAADAHGKRVIHYIVEHRNSEKNAEYLSFLADAEGTVPSLTRVAPGAAWAEREAHELYGIDITGHPDLRSLVLHDGETANDHPPNRQFRAAVTEPYEFMEVGGVGVCEVAVGPVHAGIIEPGHFRFSVVGDRVINLELRHFYTHKGTETLFEGNDPADAVPIAESVSGDNCLSHAVAYSQAVEQAYEIVVPPRAESIRAVGLEIERLLAHIGDFGALCGDVGFAVAAAYASGLKETLLQASMKAVGTRYWRGIAAPGGVRRDLDATSARELARVVRTVCSDFKALAQDSLNTPSVQNRFEETGILRKKAARDLGVVGPVARASGISMDVRRDHTYGAYRGLSFEVPTTHYGDVMARAKIRVEEASISAHLIASLIAGLPDGPVFVEHSFKGSREGYASVESPRGELFYWIETREGRLSRCHVRSPSFQNWPALPLAMPDNIIADFPLINKSFNLSYSGCDR